MIISGPMACSPTDKSHRTGSLYGAFAYGSLILTCFGGFLARDYYYHSEWMVPVVFVLGAIFATLGVLGSGLVSWGEKRMGAVLYYVVQCAVVTGILFLSPIRGFMGLIVLPLMSQAVFDLRPRWAAVVGIYLFGIDVGLWVVPYGWNGAVRAFFNYFAAFAFTVAFTIITGRALAARTREEKLRQEIEAANQRLREQAQQAEVLATTQERNRVAREIHDGVGHYLTVVKTQLDAAAGLLPAQPERAREAVMKAGRLAGEALDDVRRSVGSLRTDATRPPLPDALQALADDAGGGRLGEASLPVTVRIEGEVRALAPGVEHALFRSAQEGLTNVRKHAQATSVEIVVEFRGDGWVALTVRDDGRGANNASGGFGLVGVRERVELLGGRVRSGNRAGGGFELSVEVPA